MYTPILEYHVLECHVLRYTFVNFNIFARLKIDHCFSSFQWGPLPGGMNEIFATLRPPITIFLMAGTLTTSCSSDCAIIAL